MKRNASNQRYFDGELDISGYAVDSKARVYVEAYHKRSLVRFDYGVVGNLQAPKDTGLGAVDFGVIDHLSFRVRVVDESSKHGRVLALAQDIEPELDDDERGKRQSLLPVDHRDDLDQEVWRLAFTARGPVLEVNNRVSGIRELSSERSAVSSACTATSFSRDT